MSKFHTRNPAKHEYELQRVQQDELADAHGMMFVGNREATAIARAVAILAKYDEEYLKLYHSYPSPGPARRYVGRITRDGKLHRVGGA